MDFGREDRRLMALPELGSVKHRKFLTRSPALGAINIETNEMPVGFKSIINATKNVLDQQYPYYSKSLKRKRNWGLETVIDVFSNLSKKAENEGRKSYDLEELGRVNEYLKRQINYNRDKYSRDTILNSERSELLPIQVVNALKSFNLFDIPISSDGVLLSPFSSEGVVRIGQTKYYDWNKKGELNPLRIPRLRNIIAEVTGVDSKYVIQFPEYRILRAWIGKRGKFQNELQKILKYQNKMNDPKRMSKLISDKIASLTPNRAVPENVYENARSFIHPSDMANLEELGERVLLPESMTQFTTNKDRLKPFFNKMLNSGKLAQNVKRRFAEYMEKYPSDIRNMII